MEPASQRSALLALITRVLAARSVRRSPDRNSTCDADDSKLAVKSHPGQLVTSPAKNAAKRK